MLGKTLRFKIR